LKPLGSVSSLKLKLGIVIVAAVFITALTTVVAALAGMPALLGAAAGIALALGIAQLLARGTTAPLREMATVARAMAAGEHGRQVAVTTNDEVGELARAFNRMTAELAQTDRLRRDLVANVSHELRTPIGALQAVLENVAAGVSEPDRETVATMLAQTRRLGRLVTQLLDLSRLEAGEQPFDIRPFALRDVLDDAVREARLQAPSDVVFAIDAARADRRGGPRARSPSGGEPRRERGALLGAASRCAQGMSARAACSSKSRTTARESRRRISIACSSASTAVTACTAPWAAAPASVSRSRAGSSTCTVARSAPSGASRMAAGWW
jgi:signal transduction histidine kinase